MTETDKQHEWRWPAHIVMSPSSLNAFSQCHFRNKLRYLQNIDPPDTWIRAFAVGNAAHDALRTIANQMKVGAPIITDEQLRVGIGMKLPIPEYPSEAAREADIELVLRWIRRGERYLQSLDVQEYLLIESQEYRAVSLLPSRSQYRLTAKPDLIVRRTDEDGEFIHMIDWKTGKAFPNEDVPVIMRYVTKEKLQQWTGNASDTRVVFSWNWLDLGYADDVDVSVEHANSVWPGIVDQMEAMATETEWKATPGWYCRYCPYYQNYCPEEIPKEEGDHYE